MAARRAALRRMTDRCAITRRASAGTYDPATMRHGDPTVEDVWEGPCRISDSARLDARLGAAGETEIRTARWRLDLPLDGTEDVRPGDLVEITVAEAPGLTGQRLTVSGAFASTASSARRLPVERLV